MDSDSNKMHELLSNYRSGDALPVPAIMSREYTLESIEAIVCEKYGLEPSRVHEKTRKREVVHCRQLCMYMMLEFNAGGPSSISRFYDQFDHTTVIHSKQKILEVSEVDKEYADEVDEVKRLVIQKHIVEMATNKVLTAEEKEAIRRKAVEDATTILVNAANYIGFGWSKPITANVTGPDGKIYKITFELHGIDGTTT